MKSNHTIMNYRHIKAETDNSTVNSVMGLKEWGLIILLSIVWGGSFFFAKVAVKEMTPLTIVLCRVGFASLALLAILWLTEKKMPMLCGSTIMMIPMTLIVEQPWNLTPGMITWTAILGLSVISTSLAYIIYFRILATLGPTNLLLVTFIIPVIAILLGVMVLGEKLGWNVFGGMTLIFLGLIAIDGRLIPKFGRKKVRLCENC